jgi:ATP-dependent Clp protease ATP-binding subunit ClpB
VQFRVEKEALKKETDAASKERLGILEKEIMDLQGKNQVLREQWDFERGGIDRIKKIKEEMESLRQEIDKAERIGDLGRAAELKYGRLPDLERTLKNLESKVDGEKTQLGARMLKEEVGPEEIAEVVAKWTGIPVAKMLESETQKLLKMEDYLQKRVVGQDHALQIVADSVRRARVEISDPNRPTGTFLFLGPTGVGKTETVKALAEFLFDDDKAIVRVDMSEYMEKHAVARLIGAPPGYIGYEEGGQLTEAVRRKPYSVVLFDEIEKAHPDVFNILLQVLDEGRLTDGQGRTVDFRNTVFVMTSNIGSTLIADPQLKDDQKEIRVRDTLKQHFRPEFLNRIDEIILYKSLGQDQMSGIVRVQLEEVAQRLKTKRIQLEFSKEVLTWLSERGFDPVYGARPLKRVIQKDLLNPLAKEMLSGKVRSGDRVSVKVAEGGIKFDSLN